MEVISGRQWDFAAMTMPECDMTLKAKWSYEPGYDPTRELVDSVTGNEAYDDVVNGMQLDLKASTGVQALLNAHGIGHDALAVLNDFYYFTGWETYSTVLDIPQKVLGKPIVCVDGSKIPAEARPACGC